MTNVIDRVESVVRHLLRMQPKPSDEARVTPFVEKVRDVRREALRQERSRSFVERDVFPERRGGGSR